jgi:hypothetical protein
MSWTDGVVLLRKVASQSRPPSIIVRHSWLSEHRCNNETTLFVAFLDPGNSEPPDWVL